MADRRIQLSDGVNLADLLGRHTLVHRYDQRGCGSSDPSDDQTLTRAVADLAQLRSARRLTELTELPQRTPAEEREFRVLSWFTDYADPTVGRAAAREFARVDQPINWVANRQLMGDVDRLGDEGLLAYAENLRLPALFVHSAHDPRPWCCARDLADRVDGARWELLPDAGHLPWVKHPDDLGGILADFARNC